MESLMNVNSKKLIAAEIDKDIAPGDLIYSKGTRITGFGRTWKVVKVTPKQVKCVAEAVWFPVFENTSFGRIAKGEDPENVSNLTEWFDELQRGTYEATFWRNGKRVGEDHVSHVVIFE
jgi:hypothetical protein